MSGSMIELMRKLFSGGKSVLELAILFNVSEWCVLSVADPEGLEPRTQKQAITDSSRRRTLGTSSIDGELVILTGLNKRPYLKDRRCELCGTCGRLSYHHWIEEKSKFGHLDLPTAPCGSGSCG